MGVLLFLGCLYSLSAQEVINVAVEPLEQRNLPKVANEENLEIPDEELAWSPEPKAVSKIGIKGITLFQFEDYSVRVVAIDGEPWFVAKDLCHVLEIGNPSDAVARLDEDEWNTIVLIEGIPGNPNTSIVSESGMYSLILTSRKPEAKRFKKWITAEVLPTIRKTGSYSVAPEPSQPPQTEKRRLAAPIVPESWRCYFTTFVYAPNACEIFLQWTTCSLKRPSVKVAKCRPYFSAMLVCPVELSR